LDKKKYNFQKLTPRDDINLGVYEDALNYVFENQDICNVAVSGAYGAGKSSVLETYKKRHPDKKFLHVSLARFTGQDAGEKMSVNLEGKIINQLVHQIPPEQIPQTKFVIKQEVKEEAVAKYTARIMAFLLLCLFIWFHDGWCRFVDGLKWQELKGLLALSTAKEMVVICGIVCIVLAIGLCRGAVKRQLHRGLLKNFRLKGSHFDIELFDGETDSYFDKYLNEVLYLLRNTGVDAIVFEDMDRYDRNEIFGKLREINTLFNRRGPEASRGKPLRFFYLLRDDMFQSKDRTKFFDFILSVVPVVDGSNSLDIFLEYFSQSGIEGLFEPDFLKGLSLYVDDMRVLKNICNEFLIYYEKIRETLEEVNPNKLLAMITYKNLFPVDFSRLQVLEGYVYHLFHGREETTEAEKRRIREDIAKLDEEDKAAGEERCRSLDELDALYFVYPRPIRIGEKTESQFPSRADFIAAVKKKNYIVSEGKVSYGYGSLVWSEVNVKEQFDALASNQEYARRKAAVEKKDQAQKAARRSKRSQLEQELDRLSSAYLKDIINQKNADQIFEAPAQVGAMGTDRFTELKTNTYFPLIRFLVRNGYLDETYPDYMTLFYNKSISRQDKLFLLSITDGKAKPYDYALQDIPLVISGMRQVDFEEPESWNYQLLDALLANSQIYRSKLERFLYGLWNWEPVEFVEGYLGAGKLIPEFVREFNRQWGNACTWILEGAFSQQAEKIYIRETLYTASDEELAEYNAKGSIATYLCEHEEFLHFYEDEGVETAKLIHGFEVLKVKFKKIDGQTVHPELLQEIYSHNMYELTGSAIDLFLERSYCLTPSGEFRTKNLTLVLSKEQPLAEYVRDNLEEYLKIQIAAGEQLYEAEDTICYVLNEESVDAECKREYVKLVQTKLSRISAVQDRALWTELLSEHAADTWDNLFDYFYLSGKGMDEALVHYLNRYRGDLDFKGEELDKKYGENAKSNLFRAVLGCDALDDGKYRTMLNAFQLYTSKMTATGLRQEKIRILIEDRIIHMSPENLHFLREHYGASVPDFIKKDVEEYLNVLTEEEFDPDEAAVVLESDIPDEQKLKLLAWDKQPVSVMHKGYSEKVTAYILQHNLDEGEKEQLYNWYPENMPAVRTEIRRIAVENIDSILKERLSLREPLLGELLNGQELGGTEKKILLACAVPSMSKAGVRKQLNALGLSGFKDLLDGKSQVFSVTEENAALLGAFQTRGLLREYEMTKTEPKLYRASGRKGREKIIS